MRHARLIVAQETPSRLHACGIRDLTPGDHVSIGREAEMRIGDDPPDPFVSRMAVEIGWDGSRWAVKITNRNGALVHPWGLPPVPADPEVVLAGGRVALRLLGSPGRWYWILLEDDDQLSGSGADPDVRASAGTWHSPPARPLTAAQRRTVYELFGDLLAWPPVIAGTPTQLKQVARRLDVSTSAVQERLGEVRDKAVSQGLSRQVRLTDPEYVHVLVRAGYLSPTGLTWSGDRAFPTVGNDSSPAEAT